MIATGNRRCGGHPHDAGLLDAVHGLFEVIDPMPTELPDRIRLALALRDLEAELARFASPAEEGALAARGAEQSRIVTFDSDSLTIMIRVDANLDGTVRVDGWLAPPQRHSVEMKTTDRSITVTADELGRFVFYSVPRGCARLIVRPPESSVADGREGASASVKSVITPALTLLIGE
jgi:hypothetical protein